MSAGAIFQHAVRLVTRRDLQPDSERDVIRALDAARSGPLAFVYDAGFEAGLTREPVVARGAAVFFSFAAANLADDIADGECTYLDAPTRAGPTVQFILQNLAYETLAETTIPRDVIACAARDLVAAAAAQLVEMRTTTWTAARTRDVGDGIAGLQYSAYLRLLWAETPLEPRAARIGGALGFAAHIARDLVSRDPRIQSLSPDERLQVVRAAYEIALELRKEDLRCIEATLRGIEPTLESAL